MLRSASASVPVWRARASVSACSGFRSDIDAVATPERLIVGSGLDRVEIGNAAQRQRQRAGLARAGKRLGLLGLPFKRDGLADHDVLAVFFLRSLVDSEHANIGQDDFRDDDIR